MADAWRPANELEHRMRDAVQAGDQETYFRLLAEAELVVPVPPDRLDGVLTNRVQPTWPTREEDGRVHVLAFTSSSAMRDSIGPGYRHFLRLKFSDAAAAWPDSGWWLAVNADLPIEARLPSWFVRQITEGDPRPPRAGRAVPSGLQAPPPAPQAPLPPEQAATAPLARVTPAPVSAQGAQAAPEAAVTPQSTGLATPPAAGPAAGPDTVPQPDAARATTPIQAPAAPGPEIPHRPDAFQGPASGPDAPQQPGPEPAAAPGAEAPQRPGSRHEADAAQGTAPVQDPAVPAPGPNAPQRPEPAQEPAVAQSAVPAQEPSAAAEAAQEPPPGPHGSTMAEHFAGAEAATGPQEAVRPGPETEPRAGAGAQQPAGATVAVPAAPDARPGAAETERADFQPANEVEQELLRALAGGDQDACLKVLAAAEVLLPVPQERDYSLKPGRAGFPWQTGEIDGVTVIPVFTSPERMRDLVGDRPTADHITLPFTSVARYWPDPSWSLAVNNGTPVGLVLPGERLRSLSEWADQITAQRMVDGFEPQNDIERRLFDAAVRRDGDTFFKVLASAQALMPADPETPWGIRPDDPEFPWRPIPVRGVASIQVFTSLRWMHEAIGPSRFIMPSFLELLESWPQEGWTLVVNPATPINAVMPSDRIRALAEAARPAAPEAPPVPEAPAPATGRPAPDERPAEPAPDGASPVQDTAAQGTDWTPARPKTPPQEEDDRPAGEPEPPFEPGNRIDQELYEAALSGDTDAFLRVLLGANVLVPIPADAPLEVTPIQPEFRWDAALRDASSVQVFTSLLRLREVLPESRFVYADFRELIGAWPRTDWAMVLNPGTRIGASLEGDQVQALSEWAVRVGLIQPRPQAAEQPAPGAGQAPPGADPTQTAVDTIPPVADPTQTAADPGRTVSDPTQTMADPGRTVADPTQTVADPAQTVADLEAVIPGHDSPYGPEPEPLEEEAEFTPPVVMQKVLPHGHVGWYLEQGYDRVGGFVHPVSDVTDLQTPAQLYEALGLLYEDSPFSPSDEGVYVIRWPAYCPDLYRIPFGGQTEEEVRSWGEAGWVQERPPFRGDGFAPGSAGSIREYKLDSTRLPYGAEMYYLSKDRTERFVAVYDPDRLAWVRQEAGGGEDAQ